MAATPHVDTWVQRTRLAAGPADTPRLRRFCLPYIGGGASIYHLWPDELPDDSQDDLVTRSELAGWQEQTRAAFDLHVYPGTPLSLYQQQPSVLRIVAGCLAR